MRRLWALSLSAALALALCAQPAFAATTIDMSRMESSRVFATCVSIVPGSRVRSFTTLDIPDATVDSGARRGGLVDTCQYQLYEASGAWVDGTWTEVQRKVVGTATVEVLQGDQGLRFTHHGPAHYELSVFRAGTGPNEILEAGESFVDIDVSAQRGEQLREGHSTGPILWDEPAGLFMATGAVHGWVSDATGYAIENGIDYVSTPDGWVVESPLSAGTLRGFQLLHARYPMQ